MTESVEEFIADALSQPKDAIFYQLSASLQRAFPELYLLETEDSAFRVRSFAFAGHCKVEKRPEVVSELDYTYNHRKRSIHASLYNNWNRVEWQEQTFEVVSVGIHGAYCRTLRHYVLGETANAASSFFRAVCEWNSEIRDEILVYSGQWYKDESLFDEIKGATLSNLVLAGGLKETLAHEFTSFFQAEEVHNRYGIAWKRGVLFLGPPGNGKTHAIKGLINQLGKPALYVKSFKHPHKTDHANISEVFEKARQSSPCILVFEDLDSLIDKGNRSFFLNEMDGFASNAGILTVATTNHPERLDPAILERPSRFDRKYSFELPDENSRIAYLELRTDLLEPALKLTESEIANVARRTDGFSFAYLKELFLSSLMLWIGQPEAKRLASFMLDQVEVLLHQMKTEPETPSVPEHAAINRFPPGFRMPRFANSDGD
ncbi:MAG TPA: ATP-binding protein [Fimbriimonas sp.]|nr:ATP-binding protein [Fimbriimonas sp.]